MMNLGRHVRPKSPFRSSRSRSKSPLGPRSGRTKSPFVHRRRGRECSRPQDTNVHPSELNTFEQLCLDRHDDTAAIEILLDQNGQALGTAKSSEIPDLQTASSSVSTGRSSRSSEPKKTFLKRLFKSPRKSETAVLNPTSPTSNGVGVILETDSLPKAPSTVPNSRLVDREMPIPMTKRVLSEQFDTFSNVSSLSGTRASSIMTPVQLHRHESLGMDSVKDVRVALKEMEKQLGNASNKGERISRRKVMEALFTVADSLEDMEERELIRDELKSLMQSETARDISTQQRLLGVIDEDEQSETSTNGVDDSSESSKGSNEKENQPFSLLTSVGKLFSISTDDKKAVEQVLDDLLWTEFVAARNKSESDAKDRDRSREGKRSPIRKRGKTQPVNNISKPGRARSWWQRPPSPPKVEEFEDDSGEESVSSEESPSYLPKSITVKKKSRNRNDLQESCSTPNSSYRVKLVDTESRCGYEMASTTRQQY